MANSVTFTPAVGGDGSVVTDDSNATTGLANGGHRKRLVPAFSQVVAVANNTVTKATQAAASAAAAQASAVSAFAAPGTNATSTTSTTIATGSKTFTIQSGKSFVVGGFVVIASAATPTTYMFGNITAYAGTSLTVMVSQFSGTGTLADWVISLSGPSLSLAPVNEVKAADVASAATVDLDAVSGNLIHITGSTTITAITLSVGRQRTVVFDSVLTLTNSATLIIPGNTSLVTAAGDIAVVRGDTGAVRVISYTRASGLQSVLRSIRASNVQLVQADRANIIDIVSGTFTQTFASASVLGNGWSVYIRNSGSGDITIPASDGLTNWVMYPGEVRLFQCDGTTFNSLVLTGFTKVFTSSATFVKPPGYNSFNIKMIGGGGGGASGSKAPDSTATALGGGGGGPGGRGEFVLAAGVISNTESVFVGGGGSGGAGVAGVGATGLAGGQGGATSFGSWVSVAGGSGANTSGNGGVGGLGFQNYTVSGGSVNTHTVGTQGGNTSSLPANSSVNTATAAAPSGGGGGATITPGPTVYGGGNGGAVGGVAGGYTAVLAGGIGGAVNQSGANGVSPASILSGIGGTGGGGGGSSSTGNAGNGGNGGRGAGGGGGASGYQSYLSGSGGNGGDGVLIIMGA